MIQRLYFTKKDTLQHFKIRENRICRFAVSVFDPMSSLETTITYSKRQKIILLDILAIINQFQGEGFK